MTKANLKRLEEGKLYYSISEVCSMTGLEQHVLRYWESEFPQLRPKKNRSGNRAYRSKEIKIIRYIKYLLYEEMYTIPGAKKKMADANMADLEGQLTLIRVPPTPVGTTGTPVPQPSGTAVAPSTPEAIHAAAPAEPVSAPATTASTETAHAGQVDHAEAAVAVQEPADEAEDSHEQDGGAAAARLREELKRVKQELQSLLATLAASGKGST
jgi:DNA-binding transcriptional MerR regulator